MTPTLVRRCHEGVCVHHDPVLEERSGVVVAFSERTGGASPDPFASLNLAHHVGDDATAVDENRGRLLDAVGISRLRSRLVTAEQVHGVEARSVVEADAGSGATGDGPGPIAGTDALVTREQDLPLLMMYADCVPVVLVAERPVRGVAVVHAGWRGAAAGVHTAAATALCDATGSVPEGLLAYVGPHIMECHFTVGPEVLAQFARSSGTIAAVAGPLDLSGVISQELQGIGVREDRIVTLARCTAEHTDRFFSYRAEGTTGRHGALGVVLGGDR